VTDTNTELDETGITLSAAGGGEAPCSHASLLPFFKGLMQLMPDANGNIQLTVGDEGCYAVLPMSGAGTVGDPFVFMVQGNCYACCSCDDYKNMATAMKKLLDRSQGILDVLSDAHNNPSDSYTVGVERWNSVIAPKFMSVVVEVSGNRGVTECNDPLVKSGSPHLLDMTVAIKNNSKYRWMRIKRIMIDFSPSLNVWLRQWYQVTVDEAVPRSVSYTWFDGFVAFFPPAAWGVCVSDPIRQGKQVIHNYRLQTEYSTHPVWTGTAYVDFELTNDPTFTTWIAQPVIQRDFSFG
jgi:hypothetical protein